MWGLMLIAYRPSKAEGVGTSHPKLIWVRGSKLLLSKPHILKHHIPEHPNALCGRAPCCRMRERESARMLLPVEVRCYMFV